MQTFRAFGFAFAFLLAMVRICSAQMLYVTNEPGQQLEEVIVANGQITSLYNIGGPPDSLILNSIGQIIYDVSTQGLLSLFDPSTGTNTILASGLNHPRDLVLDPSGTTMLIALYPIGKLARYNLVTGTLTVLPTKLGLTVDGLAYDPAGDLFAVVSHNTVCQVDPNTGAILKQLVLEPHNGVNGGDGMTYDSYTGELWVAHDGTLGNGLIETPTDLSKFTLFQTGNMHAPDGLTSDGKGTLYIGAGYKVVQYNISSDTITKRIPVPGVDSVVLVPGTF